MLSVEDAEQHNWIFSADQMGDEVAGMKYINLYFLDWLSAFNACVPIRLYVCLFVTCMHIIVCYLYVVLLFERVGVSRRWRFWLAFVSKSDELNWSIKWGSWPSTDSAWGKPRNLNFMLSSSFSFDVVLQMEELIGNLCILILHFIVLFPAQL